MDFLNRAPNCQRILMFAESPGGSRRTAEKKGGMIFPLIMNGRKIFDFVFIDHRLSASKSFDDGLDDDNLDDSKIASALK